MTEDEQEALSAKYWDALKLVKLSSGNWALFDGEYNLQHIGTWESCGAFAASFTPREYKYEPRTPSRPSRNPARSPKPSTDQLLDLI